ncbi:MAG: hypothetical protein SGARI_007391, partial [Bacillariaceae sp.]
MTSTTTTTTVGIDIGAESTKVVLGSSYQCEIVRTDAGLHTFPTAVSFQGSKLRQVGETVSGNKKIIHLNRLLGSGSGDNFSNANFLDEFYNFDLQTKDDDSTLHVTVDNYNGESRDFSASALLAMLLSSIQKSVQATIQRMDGGKTMMPESIGSPESMTTYVLTVPPECPPEVCEQVLDAAYAAGFPPNTTKLVNSATAYAATYHRKFPDFKGGKTAMIVDMGHGQTSVSIVKFGQPGGGGDDDDADETTTAPAAAPFQVLASKSTAAMGAASVDVKLWKHFQSSNPKLANVKPKSRAGQR